MITLKFTKYGVFKKESIALDIDYADVNYSNRDQKRCVTAMETTKRIVNFEPLIIWNKSGYLKELGEA